MNAMACGRFSDHFEDCVEIMDNTVDHAFKFKFLYIKLEIIWCWNPKLSTDSINIVVTNRRRNVYMLCVCESHEDIVERIFLFCMWQLNLFEHVCSIALNISAFSLSPVIFFSMFFPPFCLFFFVIIIIQLKKMHQFSCSVVAWVPASQPTSIRQWKKHFSFWYTVRLWYLKMYKSARIKVQLELRCEWHAI